jgi:hypothetical protein
MAMHNLPVSSHTNVLHSDIRSTQVVSIDGLEAFFDDQQFPEKGLTIEQACLHYRQPIKKLKRLIKSGQIAAIKLGLTDTTEDWRIFPHGVPQDFSAATRVFAGSTISKRYIEPKDKEKRESKAQRRKEERLLVEGEVASLRADVNMLEQKLTNALDHISLVNYELDVMKQVVSQIGVSTTWLNNRLMEVRIDQDTIEKLSSSTVITISEPETKPALQTTHTAEMAVVEPLNETVAGKNVTWLGNMYRWIKAKVQ